MIKRSFLSEAGGVCWLNWARGCCLHWLPVSQVHRCFQPGEVAEGQLPVVQQKMEFHLGFSVSSFPSPAALACCQPACWAIPGVQQILLQNSAFRLPCYLVRHPPLCCCSHLSSFSFAMGAQVRCAWGKQSLLEVSPVSGGTVGFAARCVCAAVLFLPPCPPTSEPAGWLELELIGDRGHKDKELLQAYLGICPH